MKAIAIGIILFALFSSSAWSEDQLLKAVRSAVATLDKGNKGTLAGLPKKCQGMGFYANYTTRKFNPPTKLPELYKEREYSSFIKSCMGLEGKITFADAINKAVRVHLIPKYPLGSKGIRQTFKLPEKESDNTKVSLASHPMCPINTATLNRGAPTKKGTEYANTFQKDFNAIRERFLKEKDEKKKMAIYRELEGFWTFFMGTLAYSESLSTADTKYSKNKATSVTRDYKINDYTKPSGVKFYYDTLQKEEESRINLGLFQFSPYKKGNISHCITKWNEDFPQCEIKDQGTPNLIKLLAASDQIFNAYCGVNKIVGTFQVQVNTSNRKSTHPNNHLDKTKIKPAAERCVTMHFHSGWAYNHFGPLQKGKGHIENLLSKYNAAKTANANFVSEYLTDPE